MPRFRNPVVSTADIADGSITTAKLADGAVDTGKLADLAVAASKLADAAVSSTKIADLAVEAAKLADSAVTTTKIANAAVGSAAIANLAVGTAAIANAAIGSAKISAVLQSDNWDGTTVAARDATVGWRIERDTGNVGLENLVARGDVFSGGDGGDETKIVDGKLEVTDGSDFFAVDPSNFVGILNTQGVQVSLERSGVETRLVHDGNLWVMGPGASNLNGARLVLSPSDASLTGERDVDLSAGGSGTGDMTLETSDSTGSIFFRTNNVLHFQTGGASVNPGLVVAGGDASFPGLRFAGASGTGIYQNGSNTVFVGNGVEQFRVWISGGSLAVFESRAINNLTTSAGANVNVGSSADQLRRSTSSAKYKRKITDWRPRVADWEALRTRRWESNIPGEKGQVFRGFVFEELPGVFQAREVEDLRAIVAALVHRVKLLEAAA